MRAININKYDLPDKSSVYLKQKQYYVFLGNSARRYFTSEKETKCFLAETNRFLNESLHELNYIYGVVFSEYRKLWFYMNEFIQYQSKMIDCFKTIDRLFELIVTKGHTINGNVFIFNYITSIADNLNTCLDLLSEVNLHKKYFADQYRVKSIIKELARLMNEISDYGKK